MQKIVATFSYNGASIPYETWITSPGDITTILFLGTVQVGRIPEWTARLCPPHTAVVQGAPHWLAKPDGSDTTDFVFQFGAHAFHELASCISQSGVTVMADSQAAPFILHASLQEEYAHLIRRVILIQPLGLNTLQYHTGPAPSVALFKQRVARNALYQLPLFLTDHQLRYSYMQIYKNVGRNMTQADAQYAAGLAFTALDDLAEACGRGMSVSIVSGEHDKLFPPEELREALKGRGLQNVHVEIVPHTPHSPLATKQGKKLLSYALKQAR